MRDPWLCMGSCAAPTPDRGLRTETVQGQLREEGMAWYVGKVVALLVALCLLSAGCDFLRFLRGSSPPPRIPEVDSYAISLAGIHRTSIQEEIRAILGDPPFVHERYGEGRLRSTEWWYPIRHLAAVPHPGGANAQRQVIPAVELRIGFNGSGQVREWGFFHPVTHSRLPIRESLEQADAWFGELCHPPKPIVLANVLRQGTPKEHVLQGMRWFHSSLVSTSWERSQVRVSREGPQEWFTYFADHPSPLYVPSFYAVVTFNTTGSYGTQLHYEGWGGCK